MGGGSEGSGGSGGSATKAYNIFLPAEVRSEGFDTDAFHRALDRLVQHHEALRTQYVEREWGAGEGEGEGEGEGKGAVGNGDGGDDVAEGGKPQSPVAARVRQDGARVEFDVDRIELIDASTAAAMAAKGGESKGSKGSNGGESKHEGESKAVEGSDRSDRSASSDNIDDVDDAEARRTRARSMARGWFVSHGYAPFDLSRGALLRGRVLEVHAVGDPTNVVARFVVLVVHHIAVDLWSLVILLRDLGLFYDAEKAGGKAGDEKTGGMAGGMVGGMVGGTVVPRPPTAVTWQYTDFAREQRRGLRGASGERMWQYWKQELTPLPPVLQLPTDRPRPPKRTFGGSAVNFAIGPRPTAQLRRMCAEGNLTPYSVLLAAFKTLLGRYAAAEDITVGSPMACRQSEEAEAVVGYVETRRLCALYCTVYAVLYAVLYVLYCTVCTAYTMPVAGAS